MSTKPTVEPLQLRGPGRKKYGPKPDTLGTPRFESCGYCERFPRTQKQRCYHDTLKRKSVTKSSIKCENFKRRETINGL